MTANQKSPATTPGAPIGFHASPGSRFRIVHVDKDWHTKIPCPYCKTGKISFSVDGLVEEEDGWVADTLHLDCDTEPNIDSDEWHEWWHAHSHDYCDGWHTLHERIIATLKRTTRFHFENVEVTREMGASPSR